MSLAELPELTGFFSYSREDDKGSAGRLTRLRERIHEELRSQLGRRATSFKVWQDTVAIAEGTLWETSIRTAVAQSVFFIPIITPTAIKSDHCKTEFELFLAREQVLGRDDLVFPILYIRVPQLEDEAQWRDHPVLSVVGHRQYLDWRPLRYLDMDSPDVGVAIERFCRSIHDALSKPWLSMEERRKHEEEETQRRKEEKEAQRQKEEEIRREKKEADARRQKGEADARLRKEEQEAARRQKEEEEKRKQKEEEARRQKEEEARRRKKEEKDARDRKEDAQRKKEAAQSRAEAIRRKEFDWPRRATEPNSVATAQAEERARAEKKRLDEEEKQKLEQRKQEDRETLRIWRRYALRFAALALFGLMVMLWWR